MYTDSDDLNFLAAGADNIEVKTTWFETVVNWRKIEDDDDVGLTGVLVEPA